MSLAISQISMLSLENLEETSTQKDPNTVDKLNAFLRVEQSSRWKLLQLDIGSIVVLIVLSFYHGLLLNFFKGYVKTFLIQEKNISSQKIALLQVISWPYSVKFLWAPIMDTYYSEKFGRLKTYIVPAQFGIATIFFLSSFYFDEWMDTAQVGWIAGIGLASIFLITIQEIAVDSWSVSLLHEKNLAYGSLTQSLGYAVGSIFGYQLLTYLTDEKLMKKLFQINGKAVNHMTMCLVISGVVFLEMLYMLVFCEEKNKKDLNHDVYELSPPTSTNHHVAQRKLLESEAVTIENSFTGMISNIQRFFRNTHILTLIIFLLTVMFGNFCILIPAKILLLSKGFSRSTLATIELCSLPFTQFASCVAVKFAQDKKEMQIWQGCFLVMTINNIWSYLNADNFTSSEVVSYTIQIAINGIITEIMVAMSYVALRAFFFRICDKSIGGTYLTFLNCFANLGNLWSQTLVSALSRNFSLTAFISISCFYNLIIIIVWRQKMLEMQETPKEQWQIKH